MAETEDKSPDMIKAIDGRIVHVDRVEEVNKSIVEGRGAVAALIVFVLFNFFTQGEPGWGALVKGAMSLACAAIAFRIVAGRWEFG